MSHKTLSFGPLALVLGFVLGFLIAAAGPALAQDDQAQDDQVQGDQVLGDDGLDVFPNVDLGGFGSAASDDEPVVWSASYFVDPQGAGRVEIEAEVARNWHLYSTTQKPGGPSPTKFTVTSPETAKLTGPPTPDQPPSKSVSSVYNGLTVEEHEDVVVWTVPISIPAGYEEAISIRVDGLVCDSFRGSCLPIREELTAQYAGPAKAGVTSQAVTSQGVTSRLARPGPSMALPGNTILPGFVVAQAGQGPGQASAPEDSADAFRDDDYVVQWTASLSPATVAPGGVATLKFTAMPDESFHVYRSKTDDSESSTNFVVTEKSGLKIGAPAANKPLISKAIVASAPPVEYYDGAVTWSLPIRVPADATAGTKDIAGMIAYQACTDNSCHRPVALAFETKLTIGDGGAVQPASAGQVQFASAKSANALDAAAETKWVDPIATESSGDVKSSVPPIGSVGDPGGGSGRGGNGSGDQAATGGRTAFPVILVLAFLGGVILNVMPCVLPVVGLKIMGFVSQAGEDRGRVLMLNVVYSLGIMSVFALLAVLATVFKFGWGEQFAYFPVRLGLTLALFALALSYLGVWEIPAPGMASSKASQDLQSREGLAGAFSKGAFATILATPCSGPLLGYILGLTLVLSSLQTFIIFMVVGLGMALPYLVIGFNPKLIKWLPKPGNWMETFKQLMSFLFLGTVAFFFAQFQDADKVPVFVSIIGVWFGCWIIGQVPAWEELPKRMIAWAGGLAAAAVISIASFQYLVPQPQVLAWEDYNEAKLQQYHAQGRTVLLDFSAKWCPNCILNYEVAINTEPTRKLVDELDAVAMYADYTDFSTEIKEKLEELESRAIPVLAIYPGRAPNEPIILRDIVSQQTVLDKLKQAGPSVDRTASAATNSAGRLISVEAR